MADAPILVGTAEGLHRVGDGAAVELAGREVTALARSAGGWLAVVDSNEVWREDDALGWQQVAALDGPQATCLVPAGDDVLVGTAEAHLVRVGSEGATLVTGFDAADGRDSWYTPWGGPPDTRSLAVDDAGTIYANVHVGGIPRSTDGGETWDPTIDIDTDVHQVVVAGARLLAPSAYGLAESADGGQTWELATDGLHATYLRAVAVAGDDVLVSASTGPGGGRSAVYRRPGGAGAFERCRAGLPEWLAGNVDTGWLVAAGESAAFATADGTVYVSEDAGRSWDVVASGLSPVRSLGLAE